MLGDFNDTKRQHVVKENPAESFSMCVLKFNCFRPKTVPSKSY